MKKLKTPLRYPGGKSRAVKKIFEYFPDLSQFDEFREPFIGGGSISIAVTKQHPDLRIWVNDLYWPLYNFWVNLRDNGEELGEILLKLKRENEGPEKAKKLFFESREILNDQSSSDFEKSYRFWIINKCSFSGLTESASFSASSSNTNFSESNISNLKYYSGLIKNWKITNSDFSQLLSDDEKNFVYLDPPYEIKVYIYGKKGNMHKSFNHDVFAEKVNSSTSPMAISYNAEYSVKDRFGDWNQFEFDLTYTLRSVGNYMEKQKNRKELLLLNYEPNLPATLEKQMETKYVIERTTNQEFYD